MSTTVCVLCSTMIDHQTKQNTVRPVHRPTYRERENVKAGLIGDTDSLDIDTPPFFTHFFLFVFVVNDSFHLFLLFICLCICV